jgi:hypothetical protein
MGKDKGFYINSTQLLSAFYAFAWKTLLFSPIAALHFVGTELNS